MAKLLEAFSNNTAVKSQYIRDFETHIEKDNLIRGSYSEKVNSHWNGCAITCLLNSPDAKFNEITINHADFETTAIQFPEWLGRLIDKLHENVSSIEFSQQFNLNLLDVIPVGFSNWEQIKWRFISAILQENIERVSTLNISDELKKQVISTIEQCKIYADSNDKTEEMRADRKSVV